MSVQATLTIRAAIVTALTALATPVNFAEVRPIPLALALKPNLEEAVFEKFPTLKLPACLVAVLDAEDAGKRLERVTTWLLLVVATDAQGEPEEQTLPRVDAVRALRGSQLVAGKVWWTEDNEMTVIDTEPKYSIVGLKMKSREYGA